MPLRILESPEPLSENSFAITQEPILIGSDAARLLANELRQYCSGEITGRSFLIAGHRGSGKSTLVAKAFLEIWKESERGTGIRRPLFVPLNGPSLLTPPQQPPPAREPSGAELASAIVAAPESGKVPENERAQAAPPPRPIKTEVQMVLEQIVLALHRAAVREFSDRFRLRARELSKETSRTQRRDQVAELSAQFAVDLMECPDGARLRSYFSRLTGSVNGASLERGLLGREWATSPEFQAAEELLALSSLCEAYKRISGDYARTDKMSSEMFREFKTQLGRHAANKEYLAPILSLLTGGLAGVGAHAAGSGGLSATVAGVLAAFAAVGVVNYTSKHTESNSRVESFIFDLSLATLDRAIPVLIQRLWNAGLAPMFVVDELDKVDTLDERMAQIVHHLKKLVAENAFFCFLTDREYFENMLRQSSNRAYPKEYTYYSRRLFSVLQAHDFADYLKRLIPDPAATHGARNADGTPRQSTSPPPISPTPAVSPTAAVAPSAAAQPTAGARIPAGTTPGHAAQPTPPHQPAAIPPETPISQPAASATRTPAAPSMPPQPTAASAQVGQVLAAGQAATESTARELLIWILRHRCQLHPLDLQRQITALVGDRGSINLTPQQVQRPAYLIDLTMQVLIEALLNDEDVRHKVASNHEELRLVHDALYFITREWLRGADELEINSAGERRFGEYLELRTGVLTKESTNSTTDADAVDADDPEAGTCGVGEHDKTFLFSIVRRLAEALADTALEPASPAGQLIFKWEESVRSLDPLARSPIAEEVKTAMLKAGDSVLEVSHRTPPARGQALESVIYRWRYFPSGSRRMASVASQSIPPAVSSTLQVPSGTLAAGTAPAMVQVGGKAPLETFESLQRFMSMLNRAMDVPESKPEVLRYDLLADRFRLLPTTPPWQAVETAGRRLTVGVHREQELDSKLITDFALNLETARQNILRALTCAAVIGSPIPETQPYERVLLGLDILTRALHLQQKRDPTKDLATLWRQLEITFASELSLAGLGMAEPTNLRFIEASLTDYSRLAPKIAPVDNSLLWQRLRLEAWESAQERIIAYTMGTASPEPHLAEMLCFANKTGPANLIPFDLANLTAANLTHALALALEATQPNPDIDAEQIPGWVGIVAMHVLGFGSFNPSDLEELAQLFSGSSDTRRQELFSLYARGILANRRPADNTVIFTRRQYQSIVADWGIRSNCLLVAGTVADYVQLVKLPLRRFIGDAVPVIAIEMDATGQFPREFMLASEEPMLVTKMRFEWQIEDAPKVFVYPQSLSPDLIRKPALIAPKGPEEIARLALHRPTT